jgi:hypothetical protein
MRRRTGVLIVSALIAYSARLDAQRRMLHVVGDDSIPVGFANVTVEGERARIADERGEIDLGQSYKSRLTLDVRRIGYEPWFGKLAVGDTGFIAEIRLKRITRRLFTVKITDSSLMVPSYLRGFYQRMLDRQRGIGTGFYITPEEVEKRNVPAATSLLQGLNGISLGRTASGRAYAMSSNGTCMMTVLIDGQRLCPARGCDGTNLPSTPQSQQSSGLSQATTSRRQRAAAARPPTDDYYVLPDNVLTPSEVAAIEVYPRGATVPLTLPTSDQSCGIVAIWTGGRKAP